MVDLMKMLIALPIVAGLYLLPAAGFAQPETSDSAAEQTPPQNNDGRPVLEDAPPPPLPGLKSPPPQDPDAGNPGDVPIPPKVRNSQEIVPAVRITTDDEGRIIEEYSTNGEIYMVKVTPTKGPAYYLIDTDGDGVLEGRQFESDNGIKPVHWKLLEWD